MDKVDDYKLYGSLHSVESSLHDAWRVAKECGEDDMAKQIAELYRIVVSRRLSVLECL